MFRVSPRRTRSALLRALRGVFVVTAVALCLCGRAGAQTPPKLEFDQAIQQAIAKNPTIAQAATAIGHAQALVQQARAVVLPTVNARVTNLTYSQEVAFSGLVAQPQNQSTFLGVLAAPVLDLSHWASVTQARDQVHVAELATDTTRRDIALVTATAYLTIIATRRQVDVDSTALDNARAHFDFAQKRLQGGAGTRVDQLRAATLTSAGEFRLENSRFALRRAQEALGVLVAADSPIDAGAEPAFDMPASLDEAQWAQARPDVLLQLATQHAAERVVRDSWRDWVGTATVAFTPQYVAPAGIFQPSKTWNLGITFVQPIFEGGERKAVRRLREIQVDQTKLVLSEVMIRARSEVRIADEAVRSAQRALDSARLGASQAAEVLRITTSAFELGATTNIEVIDAQRDARDADTATTQAEDALRRAKLDLLVAVGRFPR